MFCRTDKFFKMSMEAFPWPSQKQHGTDAYNLEQTGETVAWPAKNGEQILKLLEQTGEVS